MPAAYGAKVSIYDYPEHLNPFFEDDNHNKIRFWARTKNLVRSNSFSFSRFNESFKGIRSSFRSNSRSRKPSLSTEETSPITLRKNRSEERVAILDENGFLIRSNEKKYYEAALPLSPYLREKHFEPLMISTPRKTFPYPTTRFGSLSRNSEPGYEWKRSTVSLNPFEDSIGEFRRHNSLLSKSGSTLPRKKRRAPLPPSTTINIESTKNDSGIDIQETSILSQLETSNFNEPLQITESDLNDSPPPNPEEQSSVDAEEMQSIIQSIIDLNKDENHFEPENRSTELPKIVITPSEPSEEILEIDSQADLPEPPKTDDHIEKLENIENPQTIPDTPNNKLQTEIPTPETQPEDFNGSTSPLEEESAKPAEDPEIKPSEPPQQEIPEVETKDVAAQKTNGVSETQISMNPKVPASKIDSPVPFPRTSARKSLLKSSQKSDTIIDKSKPNPIPKPKRSHLHKFFSWAK